MGVGRGHGKLILFGEHSAVYGHPAVGVRLDAYLEVELEAGARDEWLLPDLDAEEERLVRASLAELSRMTATGVVSLRGFDGTARGTVRLRGTLPMSVGFGSSAAYCTALLRAAGFDGDERELWTAAHRLEHLFHGTPSGIDTGLSIYSGASSIVPNPPALPDRSSVVLPSAWLVVGAVPRTSTTAALVAGIRRRRETDPEQTDDVLHELGRIARAAGTPHECSTAGDLGALADAAHRLLRTLALSTDALESAIGTLLSHDATGAKLSGAGGGGAFFGVFESERAAAAAAGALREQADRGRIELRYAATMRV